jgi:hypothetical protein
MMTISAGDFDLKLRIEEPAAWYGPIVMNTGQELGQAVRVLRRTRSCHGERVLVTRCHH